MLNIGRVGFGNGRGNSTRSRHSAIGNCAVRNPKLPLVRDFIDQIPHSPSSRSSSRSTPSGWSAIFIGLGANVEPKRRQQEALLGIGTALAISVGFMFLGKLIFQALGITVADFQVAGGLLLLDFRGPRPARCRRRETPDDRGIRDRAARDAADRRAGPADCAAGPDRFRRNDLHATSR